MTALTPETLYKIVLSPEDKEKVMASRYYNVNLVNNNIGMPLNPYHHLCNLRIDFDKDGNIYRVEWI